MKRTLNVRSLLGLVGVVATALGSMRVATDLVTKSLLTLLLLVCLGSLTGAIVRRQASWIGFAVFSWGYLTIVGSISIASSSNDLELSQMAITSVANKFHDDDLPEVKLPDVNKTYISELRKMRPGRRVRYLLGDSDSPDASMLTTTEVELMKQYEFDRRSRDARSQEIHERNGNAKSIGFVWMAILFGIVGSLFGQFLGRDARPRRSETNSSPI